MLKKFRIVLAVIFFVAITLLFLDFTGTMHHWFGWMAKMQFLPALLSLNFLALIILLILTLTLGRVYCSVICPLGVMQDCFGWFGKKFKKNRFSFSPERKILRYTVFALMVIAVVFGAGAFVALLAPYSAYGRIAQSLIAPVWQWVNNLLAGWSESHDNYAFSQVDIWMRGTYTLIVAITTLVVLGILAFINGRTYCNTICPVGTVLGFLSRFSLLKPVINPEKCNRCGLCSRNCKSSCIDSKSQAIDYSRCVACFDCIGKCNKGAISYSRSLPTQNNIKEVSDGSRRQFMTMTGIIASAAVIKAEEKTVDGGLATIIDKEKPNRKTKIVPPGALSIKNLESHCTACQLCVANCPNEVLRPSGELESFMQPESSYERGYCRPECTRCSEVCPAGAILPITKADKSSIQIGHAVWVKKNCIPLTDEKSCGNCARHCPTGAITMVPSDPENEESLKIPAINSEKCIGCGACENLCPARPFSAIYVEGHERHRVI